jgi:hypothetical protein
MKMLDKAAIDRLQEKLDMDREDAKELVNIIRKLAADEYDKKIGDVPF